MNTALPSEPLVFLAPADVPRGRGTAAVAWLLCVLGVLTCLAGTSTAKLCGDDVDGIDVPCDCGDTVVSDLVLTDDPVLTAICPHDGLIVRAVSAPRYITIDLHGHTMHGAGDGAGLWILYGGPGGARVLSSGSPARIEGFRDGVVAQGSNSLAQLEGVVIAHSMRDGVRVLATNFAIHSVEAQDSGRDGFALNGHDFEITATRALHSGRNGYMVMGLRGMIGAPAAGNMSQGSGAYGFNIDGAWHGLVGCVVTGAGKDGVRLNGMHYSVSACVAQDNADNGIAGAGIDWHIRDSHASRNGGDGLAVRGASVIDDGGNSGAENFGQHRRGAVVQCAINGVPCAQ